MSLIPKIIFIVPYRNRKTHKLFFSKYMLSNLQDIDAKNFEIYFSHQCDDRPFNRGACKNIGFLAIKHKYPDNYKEITFIFNDIDTIPYTNIFQYETRKGIVKHFYGFNYALGGIVSINGEDFEKINGFPNFWGWGMEDAILQKRCEKHHISIDRNHFYPIGSPEILHLFDGVSRIINKKETIQSNKDNGQNGLNTLYRIKFIIDTKSNNQEDNENVLNHESLYIINILDFFTLSSADQEDFYNYDLREPTNKILNTDRIINKKEVNHTTLNNQWSNIPFYPNYEKKKQMIQKFGIQKTEEIIKFHLQNN